MLPCLGCLICTNLETLAYRYGTDKSHDDHNYVDLYDMLLDSKRLQIVNMTEIGIAAGQSLQMWRDYFPSAHIWGVDPYIWPVVRNRIVGPHIHAIRADSQNASSISNSGLSPETMDLIVDDGEHSPMGNMLTLENMWTLLKPGGLYFIEDVSTGHNRRRHDGILPLKQKKHVGFSPLVHDPTMWTTKVKTIFQQNHVFFADTMMAQRDFDALYKNMRRHGGGYVRSRIDHNSHVIVLRKRTAPLQEHTMMFNNRAMRPGGVASNKYS